MMLLSLLLVVVVVVVVVVVKVRLMAGSIIVLTGSAFREIA